MEREEPAVFEQAKPRGRLIMFRPRSAKRECVHRAQSISQDRLLLILNLQIEEGRVSRELREQMRALQADIASGAVTEAGPLEFDLDIRAVRRTGRSEKA